MQFSQTLRQYTAVAVDGRGILIGGAAGIGKTSLALCLIDRGAVLIGDDGVALSQAGSDLVAAAPKATAGLIEIRGVGIATLPHIAAPVSLIFDCVRETPRYVEKPQFQKILSVECPMLPFVLGGSQASLIDAIRAEYALAIHGLPNRDGIHAQTTGVS